MTSEITMPKLSDTMEEGKILHWLKRPGDRVRRGEALAEVETDKADMVLEAFEDGILKEIRLKEGETAPVGAVIAILAAEGEELQASGGDAQPQASGVEAAGQVGQPEIEHTDRAEGFGEQAPVAPSASETVAHRQGEGDLAERRPAEFDATRADAEFAADMARAHEAAQKQPIRVHAALGGHRSSAPSAIIAPPAASEASPNESARRESQPQVHAPQRIKASPLARRAAEEAGVDLAHVRGTGPDGRITKRDVDRYLREQQMFRHRRLVSPHEGTLGSFEEMSKMRQTIAQRMAASKREIPHFYVTAEIDMDEAVRLKESIEAAELFDEDITYNDIIIKACALALMRHPRLNSSYENGGIRIHPDINIGIAVAVEDGLVVPVIRECQRLSLAEIAQAAHRLVAKAAQGGFTSAELSGGTFTISNMGMLGVEHFAAVINPPQAAILAVSAIKERPVVRKGQIVVGKTMMVTISCDHRVVDGVVAGRFLQELRRFLENPASLLLE